MDFSVFTRRKVEASSAGFLREGAKANRGRFSGPVSAGFSFRARRKAEAVHKRERTAKPQEQRPKGKTPDNGTA